MRKYFARWSPYRIRKVHVELIGKNEIYRPCSKLAGIEGTRDMYNFLGVNAPKCDAATTTDGFQDAELDAEVVLLKQEGGERLGCTEKARLAELGEVTVLKDTGRWRGVGSEESIRRTGGDRQKSNQKVPREDSKGVLFLLLVPDFEVRRVPCPQNVPGSRSCFDGRRSKGNGHHGHRGSACRRRSG